MAAKTLGGFVLSVWLGLVAATILLMILAAPGPTSLVCNVGTAEGQSEYERCLAELPSRQAALDESVRTANPMTGPVVALAGGSLVGLATHLVLRRSRSSHPGELPNVD